MSAVGNRKSTGFFGRGMYFADDPNLSHGFTDPKGADHRVIFVCSVLLGRQHDRSSTPISTPLGADFFPAIGYDSVKGRIVYNGTLREMEYIVYRYGQARIKYVLHYT